MERCVTNKVQKLHTTSPKVYRYSSEVNYICKLGLRNCHSLHLTRIDRNAFGGFGPSRQSEYKTERRACFLTHALFVILKAFYAESLPSLTPANGEMQYRK